MSTFFAAGQFVVPALIAPAGAAGLSTDFFDYANHDVATTGAGLVDWANNGALTSANTAGATWTRGGTQGLFDGGTYNGADKPPTAPGLTATATALLGTGELQDAAFLVDPISSDNDWPCPGPSGPVTVDGDTTTYAGAGSETNNGQLGTFTYGASGNTPPKDDLSNVYAVSHLNGGGVNEIFFGGERIVNNGASHIDFEFLQSSLTIPNPCAAGTLSGHRTQRDLLLSTNFTNGGALANVQLYSWSCNGTPPGDPAYDASKDGTVCDPGATGNPGKGDPQYVAVPSQNGGVTTASFGVNTGASGIACGGWVCRDATGAGTPTLAQNAFMEGGIDLAAAGFTGCINTFLPHTRSSPSFTSVLKDFAGPIAFSNCRAPSITTEQSSAGVTPGASITVGVGASVTDTATLHGTAPNVGGTVSYRLYSDAQCTQLVADAGTKTVNGSPDGNGDLVLPSSDPVTLNTAGTYYWIAEYSGDTGQGGFNQPVTSACGDEVLTVVAPNLTITKTADASTVSAGDAIGFTVTLTNDGLGTATGVTISDALPGGAGVNWSIDPAYAGPGTCSITGAAPTQTLSCNVGTLTTGQSASVHVTSSTAFASCATYPNTATATATNHPQVQASASITVQCPSLSITKTADAASVSAGSNIGFTITVSNAGPGTATGVTISDPLPAGAGISWSIDPAAAGCAIAAGTLECDLGDLAPGASVPVHVTSPTTFASCATYPNTATATATNHAPVQAQASTTVLCPGLNITKTADAESVSAGDPIGFTITVSNTGAGTATGVTLSDPLPGGDGVNWSIDPAYSGPGTCSITGSAPNQTLGCSFGDLASGASASVHVTSATANASCGAYPNTATATATNDGSVQATASTTVNCPNLTITKTADAQSVSAGSNIGFTITVSNTGVGVAKSVTLSDPLPAGAGIAWTIDPAYSGPGTCEIVAGTLSCNFGDMASGASASVHVTSPTTADTPCTVYPNTATAQATNNPQVQASASTAVLCPALAVTKTADAAAVDAGDPIGFTITVSNTGAGTATGVTLTDALPGGDGVNWSIDPAYSGPGTCSITGTAPDQVLGCSFGDLASGASASVHVTSATSFASCAVYPNTAIAAATNTAGAQASASITVNCPNLTITKTADASAVSAGDAIGFTVTVANSGPGTATSVTLSDALPGGAGIDWSIDPAYGGPGTCSITGTAPSETLGCDFGDMDAGESASVHVTSPTTAATPCAAYPNTATATATNHPQVQAQASTAVQCPGLNITKTADEPVVDAGDPIGFTISVSNTGAGTATGVTLSDPLPSGDGIAWAIDPAYSGPGTCQIAAGTLSCDFGDMDPGASASVHVTSPTTFASCAEYPNTATAAATNDGTVEASASITVNCPALSITKTADAQSVSAGSDIGFTITVTNSGPGTATGVTLSDPLPAGDGVSWTISPANGDCSIAANTLNCAFGDLASGASASVHVTSATTFASCATYPNTATANATNHPSVQAQANVTVNCPALSITKVADATPVSTGDPIGFTVTVSNSGAPGTGTALAVTLSDPLPAGDGVSWTIDPAYAGPGTCSITGTAPSQTLTCSFGDMAPGASASVHITSATTAASAGTYPNTATASATNHPSVQASATIVVIAPALSIAKVADATPVNTGDPIGFTVTVSNSGAPGTGTAKSVTLNDPLPSGDGVSWAIDPAYAGPGTCSITGTAPSQTLTCSFGDMAPGASASVHITSATTAASAGTYPNTATASATNHASVEASATIVVLAPTLGISKTADAPTVDAGEPIGFSVTVSNSGPGLAKSVTLNDPLPAGDGVSWVIDPAYAGQGTCSITGAAPSQTLACSFGDMLAGSSATVHVTSPTAFVSCGTYPNTATVAAANDGTAEAVASTVVACPNLSLTKTADEDFVSAGDPIGFTITAHNDGPGTATDVTLSDPLPVGDGISWAISPANEACSIAANTLSCDFGDLEAGAHAEVHVTSATAFVSCGEYENVASLAAGNHPQLEADASVTVDCPELAIAKFADESPVNAGDVIGFTIEVSNDGFGTARNVVLHDPLPAGGDVEWIIEYSDDTCEITGGPPNQVLECAFGDLEAGDFREVHIVSATSGASVGEYPNTATASADNHPPVEGSDTILVIGPELSITKTADETPVETGTPIGFTITVSNADGEDVGVATSVTLVDPLPAGDGVEWSIDPEYEGPGECEITGEVPDQVLECAFGDLEPGDSVSVHVVSATNDNSGGEYPNTATAAASNADPVEASATIVVIPPTPVTTVGSTATTSTTSTTVPTPVTTAAPPPSLPRTGSTVAGLAGFGLSLVAAGGALALSRKRRRAAAR